ENLQRHRAIGVRGVVSPVHRCIPAVAQSRVNDVALVTFAGRQQFYSLGFAAAVRRRCPSRCFATCPGRRGASVVPFPRPTEVPPPSGFPLDRSPFGCRARGICIWPSVTAVTTATTS